MYEKKNYHVFTIFYLINISFKFVADSCVAMTEAFNNDVLKGISKDDDNGAGTFKLTTIEIKLKTGRGNAISKIFTKIKH